MGASNSKKSQITITSIRASTEDIRSSLRRKQVPVPNKEHLHKTLIDNSKKLDTLRRSTPKKKQIEIDQLQKFVSDVSEELLDYNDDHLDKGTDESHSFIHVDPKQMKDQKKTPPKINRAKTNSRSKSFSPNIGFNLNDIEQKLSRVKNDVLVGIKNEDKNLLFLQKKKIEMLSTDLELLNIPESSQLYERKQILEKDLYKYYQRIVRREKNQARLSKLVPEERIEDKDKELMNSSRLNAIEIMIQDVHDSLQNTVRNEEEGNVKSLLEELKKIESQLNEIEDNSRENLKLKTILMKKISETKKYIHDVQQKEQMNDLDEIMEEIDKLKVEIQNKDKVTHLNIILELKKKLQKIPIEDEENQKFRLQYIEELDRFLDKIDPNHSGVVLRQKKLKSSKSLEDIMHLQEEWQNLEKNISISKLDEVKKVDTLLKTFEESIEAKRKSLADLLKKKQADKSDKNRRKSDEVIRTSAKIYDLPEVQTRKSIENVKQVPKREEIMPIKYGTIEHTLGEISKISDRVEELGKELLGFKGTSEDLEYNFFRASLIDKRQTLQNLAHRSSWNQVDVFKLEILEKIGYYEEYLIYKLNQNILEMKLNKKLDDLDAKIRRFNGSYQNILFENLDSELSNCFKEAGQIDMTEKSERLKLRTNYLKNVLKQMSRSDIPLKQEENLTDTKKVITESKEYMRKLRSNIESSSNIDAIESSIIEESLLSKTLELVNLNLKNDTPMFQDVKKLLEDIEECKNLLKKKRRQETFEVRSESFEFIESELVKIQNEISNFDGLVTDKAFFDLNQNLTELEKKLSKIEETDETQGKTLELSLRINLLKTRLDQIALESEKILSIENRVREILEIVSNGIISNDYDSLDEELINLRIELERFDVSEKLSYRKITCLSYIEYLLKKINEQHNGRDISRSIIV